MPNSILWIGLVVLWVFVLFPMLAGRHPRIRRTTDVALATRVLHRGGTKRVPTRAQRKLPHGDDAEDRMTTPADEPVNPVTEDVDRPGRDHAPQAIGTLARPPARLDDLVAERDSGGADFVPTRRGRGGYDPEADAIARAARYRFRQRTAIALVLSALLFGGFAAVAAPTLWSGCVLSLLLLVVYLGYLRRQVRLEADIRRRRAARLGKGREAERPDVVEPAAVTGSERPALDREAARDLQRRAVVLDVDDEDPAFDHLDPYNAAAARAIRERALEAEIRRAAGE
ncbi:gephyrin-like molybdotransferase receptor GlpR [Nocardia sp. BMG111209]|uniref:divisome protein SepX/GlpR n=1 Tax=Nocardia sp. BMG111209 TaxID=1160137 RepID=UPI000382D261|nr:gephyrin-like molybdotransferase receptor GlpR [Nocardia sp. BMG111209]